MVDFAEEVKARMRHAWSLGSYPEIARSLVPASQALLDACAISAGQELLDAAAGNGNLALLAAREGAAVVACDLTPEMAELGRARCAEEGYDVEWLVADVEELPFADARFDCAASVFGAMFAPRPELAASEMFRVVRPGGTVGLAAWTPGGFQGTVSKITSRYVPSPPEAPSPHLWGDEDTVRERLDGLASSIEFERHAIRHDFGSLQDFFDFSRNAGPNVARAEILSEGDRRRLRDEVVAAIADFNQADGGGVLIDNEYLVTVARKRG